MRLKLKAGALQLTTFIMIVVIILLLSFVLLTQTHRQFSVQTSFIIDTVKATDQNMFNALEDLQVTNDTIVHFDGDKQKTQKIYSDFWGVFHKITSSTQIKNYNISKVALVGAKSLQTPRASLYLKDNGKPLVIVGHTEITGDAYLPKYGIKPGTISGQSYYGSQLVYGNIKRNSLLPKVSKDLVSDLNKYSKTFNSSKYDILALNSNTKQHYNSFKVPAKLIYSKNTLTLDGYTLAGHIIVISEEKITIEASSQLKDVILIAPEIDIKAEVKGEFQAIASKYITVGKHVELSYPSALVVNYKNNTATPLDQSRKEDFGVFIDEHASVNGVVMFLGDKTSNNYQSQIELEVDAAIYGELYCNQNVELKGQVYGSVYANAFIANQFGSIYQNHIYNGKINALELPSEYIGLSLEDSKKNIVKWLY